MHPCQCGWQDVIVEQVWKTSLNTTEQVAEADARGGSQLFIKVSINGQKIRALIDSGATIDAIAPHAVAQAGVSLRPKKEPYELMLIDGEPHSHDDGWIMKETVPIVMKIQDYQEEIVLDAVPLGGHDMVLGAPWLRKHNPQIDWMSGKILWKQDEQENATMDQKELCAALQESEYCGGGSGATVKDCLFLVRGLIVAVQPPLPTQHYI